MPALQRPPACRPLTCPPLSFAAMQAILCSSRSTRRRQGRATPPCTSRTSSALTQPWETRSSPASAAASATPAGSARTRPCCSRSSRSTHSRSALPVARNVRVSPVPRHAWNHKRRPTQAPWPLPSPAGHEAPQVSSAGDHFRRRHAAQAAAAALDCSECHHGHAILSPLAVRASKEERAPSQAAPPPGRRQAGGRQIGVGPPRLGTPDTFASARISTSGSL